MTPSASNRAKRGEKSFNELSAPRGALDFRDEHELTPTRAAAIPTSRNRLRVNIGNAANARVFANGKKVKITTQAVTIGYEFTPTRSKPLPAGQRRPCA